MFNVLYRIADVETVAIDVWFDDENHLVMGRDLLLIESAIAHLPERDDSWQLKGVRVA